MALDQLGLPPHKVLHVGDSDVDNVKGAKAAGLQVAWVNRDGRVRRPGVPPPDVEVRDLTGLLTISGAQDVGRPELIARLLTDT
jgi:putative hydrolase of the HAD superfamily